eukprot:scaffold45515_cov67-Phaeocystis_antarctica.AAC.7
MRQPADSVLPPAWSKLRREVLMLAVLDFVPWPVPCLARLATVSVRASSVAHAQSSADTAAKRLAGRMKRAFPVSPSSRTSYRSREASYRPAIPHRLLSRLIHQSVQAHALALQARLISATDVEARHRALVAKFGDGVSKKIVCCLGVGTGVDAFINGSRGDFKSSRVSAEVASAVAL